MKKVEEAIMETYRRMYKEATPSADFDELIRTGEAKKPNFFMKYYLPDERQAEIIEEVAKKYRLSRWEREILQTQVYLGCAPTSVRREEGKDEM